MRLTGTRYVLWLWLLLIAHVAQAQPHQFTHMDAFDGLSDNKIQHIMQLPDGRMAFTTPETINLYDGARFRYFTARTADKVYIPAYLGAYHVYQGENDLLWIKDYKKLFCFDIRKECFLSGVGSELRQLNNSPEPVVDLFLDSEKTIWLVRPDGSVWNTRLKRAFRVPSGSGSLQDLDVINGKGYFFYSTGKVVCLTLRTGTVEYVSAAYSVMDVPRYDWMSLVVKGPDGNFYQLRNGTSAVCLQFNPHTRQWKKLLETPYILHTLIVPAADEAFITCGKGLWKLNLHTGRNLYQPSLATVEGGSVVTDINTVFIDRENGWWLGTSNNGLLYGHPWRDMFGADRQSNLQLPLKTFRPLLINVAVNGRPLVIQDREDEVLLPESVPFVRHFDFAPDQNTLTFDFSTSNYALPMQTYYRYRLVSNRDSAWHEVVFNPQIKLVDERGILHLPFSRLKPGEYRLQVMAASRPDITDTPVTEITFTIQLPWWQTVWACAVYGCMAAGMIAGACVFYIHQRNRRKREQLLMERIRNLIARCDRYEAEKSASATVEPLQNITPPVTEQDNKFLQKAVELVKAHLNSAYSVEELSRDLCMERTGLYKKLTTLLDQSPSSFIRNIRLQQAARLLENGNKSVSEVAMETGFSSSSYFSKCFQEMYGCKPSEYVEKHGKST